MTVWVLACGVRSRQAITMEPAATMPLGTITVPAIRLSPGAAVSSSRIPRGADMRPDWVERSQVNAITRLPSAQEGGPGIYALWAGAVQVRVAPVARSRT